MKFVKKNGLYIPQKKPEHYMGCMGIEDQFPPSWKNIPALRKGVMSPIGGGGSSGGSAGSSGGGTPTAIFDDTDATPFSTAIFSSSGICGVFFTIAVAKTITSYVIYMKDVNNEGNCVFDLRDGTDSSIGSSKASTDVTIAATEIADTYADVTFTLGTPYNLSAGSYWLVGSSSGAGTPNFEVKFCENGQGVCYADSTYYKDPLVFTLSMSLFGYNT